MSDGRKELGEPRLDDFRDGFRRAGYAFGADAQDIPLAALDEAQQAAIKRDRMLVAIEIDVDAPDVSEASETPEAPEAQASQKGLAPERKPRAVARK